MHNDHYAMKKILFVGAFFPPCIEKCFEGEEVALCYAPTVQQAVDYLREEGHLLCLTLFSLNHGSAEAFMQLRHFMLKDPKLAAIPFVAISPYPSGRLKELSRKFRAHDYIAPLDNTSAICNRLRYLRTREKGGVPPAHPFPAPSTNPTWKRLFDICGALALILLLSPVFILIALLIKLESRGPILYVSKRAGQGYRIFDFYKFRSMRPGADQRLDHLQQQNEYRKSAGPATAASALHPEEGLLMQDSGYVEEGTFLQRKLEQKAGTFVKIRNDPRVTRAGRFIRATSVDELPQLFNVLKGDMSLVGNRPIPLYEAEQLTSDKHIARFFAPAGITGLWQVTKNSENNISEEDRKMLDIEYARNFNFWMDLRILLKTLPAVFQHDNS